MNITNGIASWLLIAALLAVLAVPAKPAGAEGLALGQALEMAFENHPDLLVARERVRAANISVDSARADFQPELAATVSTTDHLQSSEGDSSYGTLDSSVSLNWNLYRGGADTASLEKALMEKEAKKATLERQRQTLVAEVVSRYIAALTARELVVVCEENLSWNRQQLERVRAQYQAGSRAVNDVFQQEAETEKASFELVSAKGELDVSLLQLTQTIGAPEGTILELADLPQVEAGNLLPNGSQGEITKRFIALRPDIIAQKALVDAASESITVARAAARPAVDLSASVGSGYSSIGNDDLLSQMTGDGLKASVGIAVSIPLWDRHASRNAVSQAKSNRETERLTLEGLERQFRLEVSTAFKNYRTDEAQVESADRQLKAAAKSLEAAEARYQVGASTLLEVTEAQKLYREAKNSVVEARYNLLGQAVTIGYVSGEVDRAVSLLTAQEEK